MPMALPRAASNQRERSTWIGQRSAQHVAERVEEVEEVERAEGGDAAEADEGRARDHDADQHQAARAEPVHHDAGQPAEQGTDEQLAVARSPT